MSTSRRYSHSYRRTKSVSHKNTNGFFSTLFSKPRYRARKIRSEESGSQAVFYTRPRSNRLSAGRSGSGHWKLLIVFGVVGMFAVWGWMLLFLPYFDLATVRVTGLKTIKNAEIVPIVESYLAQKKFGILKNKNFFSFSSPALAAEIKTHFYVDDIQITPVFPNSLTVSVQERSSSIIYDNGSEYVILDENGTVVKKLRDCTTECATESVATTTASIDFATSPITSTTPTETATSTLSASKHLPAYDSFALEYLNVPVVYDSRHLSVGIGQTYVLTPTLIHSFNDIATRARKNEKHFGILYFTMDQPGSGVVAVTDKGFRVYFNPDNDLAGQFQYVDVVLRDSKPTDYIDVRYSNRVYWK